MAEERSATPFDRRLGLAVRTRRLEIGMSQETLAELTDVTFQQVQKYEKGVNRIAASRLASIGAALRTSGAALLAKIEKVSLADALAARETPVAAAASAIRQRRVRARKGGA